MLAVSHQRVAGVAGRVSRPMLWPDCAEAGPVIIVSVSRPSSRIFVGGFVIR
jgi:hypothetical protein